MATEARIEIIVEGNRRLDYESPEDLGIKFNRIVENLQDIGRRFGEYSLSFNLPITKRNASVFDFPTSEGRRRVFIGTQKECRVYNNNKLLLDGIIELRGINNESFECAFFSKFTQLIDDIRDKDLRDIDMGTIAPYEYENDLIAHVNSNYSREDTDYQYPLCFYNTFHTIDSVLSGAGLSIDDPENEENCHYYLCNSTPTDNRIFHHQIPIAFYVVSVLEKLLDDAGWTLGGSFFNDPDVNKIIMLYTGENDIYDQATNQLNNETGFTATQLKLNTFLPELSQTEFISGLINMFNLYFTIDTDNRIIRFETYTTLFNDDYNPYDITSKIIGESLKFTRIDDYDPTIAFDDDGNNTDVLGDNTVMTGGTYNFTDSDYGKVDKELFTQVFDHVGVTDGEITLPFGHPNIKRMRLVQDKDISGNNDGASEYPLFLPAMTEQTVRDNKNSEFIKKDTETFLHNTENRMKHKGSPTLMYYYGQSDTNLVYQTGRDVGSRYLYINIPNLSGVIQRTKIPFANPFSFKSYNKRAGIEDALANADLTSRLTAEASYLSSIWYTLGTSGTTQPLIETNFSLTFSDDDTLHQTLYTKFHKPKYDRFRLNEVLEADMRMNDFDWGEMQINRPIKYNKEIYHILEISGYDPVLGTASVKLIKK